MAATKSKKMTNAEINKNILDRLFEEGKLSAWEQEFYTSCIQGKNKKQMRDLSSAQYKKMVEIAEKDR